MYGQRRLADLRWVLRGIATNQIARLFPESYVRELTRKGELPCVRNGKYVRVDPADVRAWTQRHRDREVDPGPSLLYAGRRGRLRSQRRASPSEVN